MAELRPKSVDVGPKLVDFGPMSGDAGPTLAELGWFGARVRSNSGQFWRILGQLWPKVEAQVSGDAPATHVGG